MYQPTSINHKNNLIGYISNWRLTMNNMASHLPLAPNEEPQPNISMLRELVSLSDVTYDLSQMFSRLEDNLSIIEVDFCTTNKFNQQPYDMIGSLLKVCLILFHMLLDAVTATIKYFYDINEPNIGIPKSFTVLLRKARSGKLPRDLLILLEGPVEWFPKMIKPRVCLGSTYASLQVSIAQDEYGNTLIGQSKNRELTPFECEDIRKYLGGLMCEYQIMIDKLLNHFDRKFRKWYGFKPYRTATINLDSLDMLLWLAYKYGNYRHDDLYMTY